MLITILAWIMIVLNSISIITSFVEIFKGKQVKNRVLAFFSVICLGVTIYLLSNLI